ncbi:hypothetical protein P9869_39205 [Streptomyces ossamyceticus]|nr:hypothetical protein [Streptomyces ossamyceticus]
MQNNQEQARAGEASEGQRGARKGSEADTFDSAATDLGRSGDENPRKPRADHSSADGTLAKRGWKKRQLTFWTPPIPPATGIGVGAGSSWFVVALATENVEPSFVWPSVVLVGMGMAYDLGRRVVDRRG